MNPVPPNQQQALVERLTKACGGVADPHDADAVTAASKELLTLHELIAHRLVQILLGLHRGRAYSV